MFCEHQSNASPPVSAPVQCCGRRRVSTKNVPRFTTVVFGATVSFVPALDHNSDCVHMHASSFPPRTLRSRPSQTVVAQFFCPRCVLQLPASGVPPPPLTATSSLAPLNPRPHLMTTTVSGAALAAALGGEQRQRQRQLLLRRQLRRRPSPPALRPAARRRRPQQGHATCRRLERRLRPWAGRRQTRSASSTCRRG